MPSGAARRYQRTPQGHFELAIPFTANPISLHDLCLCHAASINKKWAVARPSILPLNKGSVTQIHQGLLNFLHRIHHKGADTARSAP